MLPVTEMLPVTDELRRTIRVPYVLRRVPASAMIHVLPAPESPRAGDIALARLEKIGRHTRLELASGRACTLHEGDLLAVVFGNRYATQQFEGYARRDGETCHLLSMAGVCGLVASRHADMSEPSRLRLLGALANAEGEPLRLRDYALAPAPGVTRPPIAVVCGTSMDSGKTHTAMSLVVALRRHQHRVACIKLTGTATGRDIWRMLDAGAYPDLDFTDGGFPSTYLCETEELLELYDLLLGHAAAQDVACIVVEIADGVFQRETAALLRSTRFTSTVDAWVLTAGEPVAAAGGLQVLRGLGIEPAAISGRLSMSPLGVREAEVATGLRCLSAQVIQKGELNEQLLRRRAGAVPGLAGGAVTVEAV
jgi:hypothetical protein